MSIQNLRLEKHPYKQMSFMAHNFDANSFMAPGIITDEKLIEKYSFVGFIDDAMFERRAMINEGDDVTILYKFPDGTTDIVHSKYKKN